MNQKPPSSVPNITTSSPHPSSGIAQQDLQPMRHGQLAGVAGNSPRDKLPWTSPTLEELGSVTEQTTLPGSNFTLPY